MFKNKFHKYNLYNTLLILSRNIFFYKKVGLSDTFETRIYLMFFHFSIMMIIFKIKKVRFDQKEYDSLFDNIEYNLRELGFGDVSVNKKMKDLNKVLYDILLKLRIDNQTIFKINKKLVFKYFKEFQASNDENYEFFEKYLLDFYNFCFELPIDNIIKDSLKFKFNYGST